ncbi:MAG: FAD-binding domain-containing protein [Capsulimonadales bacterium]|nr:FAD-binding domain-containing protein [Capsulimonadales bacterium]
MSLFPTDYESILARLQSIDPERYDSTRNYLDGAVTRLSPYLTHGALTLPDVRDFAYLRAGKRASYRLVFELAWREYFRRVWWDLGDGIFSDIKRPQAPVREAVGLPTALLNAATGIEAIDASVRDLYETGYVHNHARLWTAMLAANIAQVRWNAGADWYYYHLLDGDLASNTLSWQWVAGTFSSKKYYANQENLNRFDRKHRQQGTFLEVPPEELADLPIPEALREVRSPERDCVLPLSEPIRVEPGATVRLYHPWSLNPRWRQGPDAVRILVLEPSHFARFPMSERRMDFLLALARNIPGLRVYVGEAGELPGLAEAGEVVSLAHPATRHFPGCKDRPAWLFPQWPDFQSVPGSFTAFWKQTERWL